MAGFGVGVRLFVCCCEHVTVHQAFKVWMCIRQTFAHRTVSQIGLQTCFVHQLSLIWMLKRFSNTVSFKVQYQPTHFRCLQMFACCTFTLQQYCDLDYFLTSTVTNMKKKIKETANFIAHKKSQTELMIDVYVCFIDNCSWQDPLLAKEVKESDK